VEPGNGRHAPAGTREQAKDVDSAEVVATREEAEDKDESRDQAPRSATTKRKDDTTAQSAQLRFSHGSRSFPREPYTSAPVTRYA
jgi:hypothetical protein